jgi:hypothetical protein
MENKDIIHCIECTHCFKSKRSETGYFCEMWGYHDFADSTILDGFCHKAKRTLDEDVEHSKQTWKGE